MTLEVRVESLEALETFEVQFAESVKRILDAINDINRIFENQMLMANDRIYRFRSHVSYLRRALAQTKDEEEYRALERALREAEDQLQRAQRWFQQAEQAYHEYRRQQDRVRSLALHEAPRALAFLRRKIEDLRAYIAVQLPAASTVAPSSAPSSLSTPSVKKWVSDFFEIDVSKVRVEDIDPNFETSHGYTRDQMEQWIEQLKAIQHLIYEKGYTEADFVRMRASSDPWERALGETYHKFYHADLSGERTNLDFIVVEWVGDHYEVINGRHRIWIAQQMGLKYIPARVSAPDEETLKMLRADGRSIPSSS
ncbi:MAG: ParB N-terminal domain-containing protein [Candidatus Caldarchaeum sp.]